MCHGHELMDDAAAAHQLLIHWLLGRMQWTVAEQCYDVAWSEAASATTAEQQLALNSDKWKLFQLLFERIMSLFWNPDVSQAGNNNKNVLVVKFQYSIVMTSVLVSGD